MKDHKRYIDDMRGKGPFYSDDTVEKAPIIFISLDMVPPEFYLEARHEIKPSAPNLDSLKKDCFVFTHALSASPLCSPSRASYLTGRYSYITTNSERAHDGHEIHLRDDDRMFPEFLKAVGYRTRHYGKSHVGTHKFIDVFSENDSPWDRWSPPWFDDELYVAFLRGKGLKPPSFERKIHGFDPAGRGQGNFYGGWIAPQDGNPYPLEGTYPFYLVHRVVESLRSMNEGPSGSHPFYLQIDFFEPHQPFAIPGGMEERERMLRQLLKLPDSYLSLLNNEYKPQHSEPRVYSLYRRYWGLQDRETLLDYRVAHMLQFEVLDRAIGRLLQALRELDLYDSSWIFFIADHGEMNGEWGLIDKGSYLNPKVLRVPLWIKPPRKQLGFPLSASIHVPNSLPVLVDTPVSLLDIAPTILQVAGIRTEDRLDGFSLLSTASGEKRPDNKPILFEVWSHVVPNPSMGMVFYYKDKSWIYTCNFADEVDELYGIDDLLPPVNLLYNPEYQDVRDMALRSFYPVLKSDPRWVGYVTAFELKYPDRFHAEGDRQKFLSC